MTRGLVLAVLLSAAPTLTAAADDAAPLRAAWGGLARANAPLSLHVGSDPGEQLTIRNASLTLTVNPTEHAAVDLPRFSSAPLLVRDARGAREDVVATKTVTQGHRLVVAALERTPDNLDLPETDLFLSDRDGARQGFAASVAGYESVDLAIVHAAVFAGLSNAQQQALAAFAGRCGRLLWLGDAPPPFPGCEPAGTTLRQNAPPKAIEAAAAHLLAVRLTAGTPSGAQLAALLPAASARDGQRTVLLAVAGTLALAWLSTLLPLPRASLLAVNMASSAILAIALATPRVTWDTKAWGETRIDDPSGEVTQVWRAASEGAGTYQSARLPAARGEESRPLHPLSDEPVALDVTATGTQLRFATTAFTSRLFARRQHVANPWDGAFSVTHNDEAFELQNTGDRPSPAARLVWRGDLYAIPALSVDQSWQPAHAQPWPDTPMTPLLKARTLRDPWALMLEEDDTVWVLRP